MDPFPQVETVNEDSPGNKGDGDWIPVTLFEPLGRASSEVRPGHSSQGRPWISLTYITNLSQIFCHLQDTLGWQTCHLPVVIFHHHSSAVVLWITDTAAPPAIPSCDALKAQIHLTNICWTSAVSKTLFYTLGVKQGSLWHNSCFQGIYRLRTYFFLIKILFIYLFIYFL